MQDLVGCRHREQTYPLEDIMDVGLGDTGDARQAAFAQLAALDTLLQVQDQSRVQLLKI